MPKKRIKADLKDLRDKVVFAFFMLNALFVLSIFLLQANKDLLHIKWPLGVKSNITYDDGVKEVTISSQYLELEPIGVVFLVFFALILVIQFTAMLFHRLGTLSHILAIAKLNIRSPKEKKKMGKETTVGSDMVELARRMMSLKYANEVDVDEDEAPAGRRRTVHHLESLKNKREKIWRLEDAFHLRYEDPKLTDNKKVFKDLRISTKDLEILEKRRTTVVENRKSQLMALQDAIEAQSGLPSSNGGSDLRARRSAYEPFYPDVPRPSRVKFGD